MPTPATRSRTARIRAASVVVLAATTVSCGSIVEVPSRDTDTPAYTEVAFRVPSFWTETRGPDDPTVVVPIFVRDDAFPSDVDADAVREVVVAAVETWLDPLESDGRPVRLPVIWSSTSEPEPERRVDVRFVARGLNWLGRTTYHDTHVEVEISLGSLSVDRALTRRELLALSIHEFGHALGISQSAPGSDEVGPPGHSPNPNDVMYGHNLDNTWITLSRGDRETILALFPAP